MGSLSIIWWSLSGMAGCICFKIWLDVMLENMSARVADRCDWFIWMFMIEQHSGLYHTVSQILRFPVIWLSFIVDDKDTHSVNFFFAEIQIFSTSDISLWNRL